MTLPILITLCYLALGCGFLLAALCYAEPKERDFLYCTAPVVILLWWLCLVSAWLGRRR